MPAWLPASSDLPSGVNRTAVTRCCIPLSWRCSLWVPASQKKTTLSALPVAMLLPSGAKATAVTADGCLHVAIGT